jgi:hypothetical protein
MKCKSSSRTVQNRTDFKIGEAPLSWGSLSCVPARICKSCNGKGRFLAGIKNQKEEGLVQYFACLREYMRGTVGEGALIWFG